MRSKKNHPPLFEKSLLATAYMPPIEFFAVLANSGEALLERCETFQKQSYRTRCHIYGANGLLSLTLPVKREGTHKLPITSLRIDYSKPWVMQHKRAMEAAYMTTPFFEYYRDDLYDIFDCGTESLFDFNYNLIKFFCEAIGLSVTFTLTSDYIHPSDSLAASGLHDFRSVIHPKSKGRNILQLINIEKPYYQVFSQKQGFISNLSIIDLLSHEGPNSISFLRI